MNQTRTKWDFFLLSRGDFWMIWRCHGIGVSIFIFCLETMLRENNWMGATPTAVRVIFFRKCHPKLFDYSYDESCFSTITNHLGKDIWKRPYRRRLYEHGLTYVSSLQQIILLIIDFSFSQTSLGFKFNLLLIE